MPSSIINSDDGVISGTSGLKSTGGDDGVLKLQTKGTDAVTVNATQVVSLANALPAGSGGTGANTLTAEAVIIGNGTSAVKFVAAGTSGNVLTSNGTAWASTALPAGGGDYIMNVYTTPGTWTKPAGLKAVKVTVVGGGGGSSGVVCGGINGAGGAGGGTSIEYIDAPAIPGPQPYTVGTGGTAGAASGPTPSIYGGTGGTSSFGGPTAFLSATGGGGGGNPASPSFSATAGGVGSNGQLNIGGEYALFGSPQTQSSGGSILGGSIGGSTAGNSNYPTGLPGTPRGYGVGSLGYYAGPGPLNGTGIAGGTGVIIVEEFY